jgi:hypothetical protein
LKLKELLVLLRRGDGLAEALRDKKEKEYGEIKKPGNNWVHGVMDLLIAN